MFQMIYPRNFNEPADHPSEAQRRAGAETMYIYIDTPIHPRVGDGHPPIDIALYSKDF